MAPSGSRLPLVDGLPPCGGPSHVGRILRGLAVAVAALVMLTVFLAILALAGLTTGVVAVALALALAVAPIPLYVGLALWTDRFEPEPLRLVVLAFAWGATIACGIALVLNTAGEAVIGSQLGAGAAEFYGGSISAPVVEETAK